MRSPPSPTCSAVSFVLGSAAIAAGAIAGETYVALVAAVAISIAVSTVVVRRFGTRPVEPVAAAVGSG